MNKREQLVSTLNAGWVSVPDLLSRTGWQAHTLRGAISTLAKANGLTVERRRLDGVTSYRIAEVAA